MRISDWSSDVCSSDLVVVIRRIQREQLAEVTEAGVHRVAPQAHDLRPWQGPGDETGVQEIVRQLVDETRRPPGIGAGAFEVTGAKLCPVDARRARDAIQVEHLRRTARSEERRVGNVDVITGRYRGSPCHLKKNTINTN